MSVLVLQLAGPLQSWGATARFARRTTENAPTKSGVIGLLAAAQGLERDADLSQLAALRFGVRIDQPGTRIRDFHTAHHPDTETAMPISQRYYLADAVFIAAVEGPDGFIEELHQALQAPRFLPYLGRRSCPPARPLDLGIRHQAGLADVLAGEPWQAAAWHQQRRRREATVDLPVLRDAEPDTSGTVTGDTVRDLPLSFDARHRRYALRTVYATTVTVPNPHSRPEHSLRSVPAHDPTSLLEDV
ncbi:type I-E CRISPR-associated protein Cas5/CasD [Streptomyces violascens]|uniref:Type I-E CRISPR-associated protein Cas5/CasD n=1 Tax=Streptomyces violascens TaxID=67381 RepID=A0ABQ3QV14_9ACTN|nr:type I-E CRISPR-associated protein Cas5/CasD [Streptomyces violascens]GHI41123.1 type I-E CRISPR-associated protein Cas5/CasD [Streptomyces violascens]